MGDQELTTEGNISTNPLGRAKHVFVIQVITPEFSFISLGFHM